MEKFDILFKIIFHFYCLPPSEHVRIHTTWSEEGVLLPWSQAEVLGGQEPGE